MKKRIKSYDLLGKPIETEISYIPFRYIRSILIIIAETVAILSVLVLLTIYVPYFELIPFSCTLCSL